MKIKIIIVDDDFEDKDYIPSKKRVFKKIKKIKKNLIIQIIK